MFLAKIISLCSDKETVLKDGNVLTKATERSHRSNASKDKVMLKTAEKKKLRRVINCYSWIIKHLMDGFFSVHELSVTGGSGAWVDTPVYKSLRLYAEVTLKMGTNIKPSLALIFIHIS
ncbi:uncharacterized protein LOC135471571 isoform X2 [Liolophura sinensis]|uniref:uncharacterized protein LOC135471571 isoform X2 n=1 Tax=Liolophura sinensis TaxID=3198878 RepID=UPI003158343E